MKHCSVGGQFLRHPVHVLLTNLYKKFVTVCICHFMFQSTAEDILNHDIATSILQEDCWQCYVSMCCLVITSHCHHVTSTPTTNW